MTERRKEITLVTTLGTYKFTGKTWTVQDDTLKVIDTDGAQVANFNTNSVVGVFFSSRETGDSASKDVFRKTKSEEIGSAMYEALQPIRTAVHELEHAYYTCYAINVENFEQE